MFVINADVAIVGTFSLGDQTLCTILLFNCIYYGKPIIPGKG
jgi:hypothetical protein